MSTVTLELPDETRDRLENKAARNGQSFDVYVRGLLEADVRQADIVAIDYSRVTGDESVEAFDKWLAELDKLPPIPMPAIPSDWSREDIYDDHD